MTANRPPTLSNFANMVAIPNRKVDCNNNGPFSTDYLGASGGYPTGSYAERAAIQQAHIDYTQGFFWFLAHDPRVPAPLQAEVNRWALAKDEFTDSENWPSQLYVREARRMVGDFVMTQADLQTELRKPDCGRDGLVQYRLAQQQRIATADGLAQNEGDVQVGVDRIRFPIACYFRSARKATNLLVPVCLSASHVAYSSLRMEPQYMILGQAAGVAAAMAIQQRSAVQDVGHRSAGPETPQARCGNGNRALMAEMAPAGKDEGSAQPIGGGDHIGIADGATGFDERCGAVVGSFL